MLTSAVDLDHFKPVSGFRLMPSSKFMIILKKLGFSVISLNRNPVELVDTRKKVN